MIRDEREEVLSDSGVLALEDAETGEIFLVDTSSKKVRRKYWQAMQERRNAMIDHFKRVGIDRIDLRTGISYEDELNRFFRRRMRMYR